MGFVSWFLKLWYLYHVWHPTTVYLYMSLIRKRNVKKMIKFMILGSVIPVVCTRLMGRVKQSVTQLVYLMGGMDKI
jgi:hypothetical protein